MHAYCCWRVQNNATRSQNSTAKHRGGNTFWWVMSWPRFIKTSDISCISGTYRLMCQIQSIQLASVPRMIDCRCHRCRRHQRQSSRSEPHLLRHCGGFYCQSTSSKSRSLYLLLIAEMNSSKSMAPSLFLSKSCICGAQEKPSR